LNTWARGCALAARDIKHVHGRVVLLDGCGLASFCDLHLARDDCVELVVFLTSVHDRFDLGRRTVVGWVGVDCVRALLLQVDLLGLAPIEAIRIQLDLVLEHGLSHVVERADSDVGGGVVVTHDGLEVLHSEEESFDGATPLESVPVLQQRRKISPVPDSAGDVELDDVVVIRSVGVLGYGVLVVRLEAETILMGSSFA
jgi:hypothetical protein